MANSSSTETQAERFKRVARQLGADESDDALDRAMDKLDLRVKPEEKDPSKGKAKTKGRD
jgi:hypothetical protein